MSKEESLEEKVTRLETENAALQSDFKALADESNAEITRLSKELDSSKSDAAKGLLTVTHEGQKFQVAAKKFHYNGKDVTVDELVKDEAMIAELVEKESGLLVPID